MLPFPGKQNVPVGGGLYKLDVGVWPDVHAIIRHFNQRYAEGFDLVSCSEEMVAQKSAIVVAGQAEMMQGFMMVFLRTSRTMTTTFRKKYILQVTPLGDPAVVEKQMSDQFKAGYRFVTHTKVHGMADTPQGKQPTVVLLTIYRKDSGFLPEEGVADGK